MTISVLKNAFQTDGRAWGSGSLKRDMLARRFPDAALCFPWEHEPIPAYIVCDSAFPEMPSLLKRVARSLIAGDPHDPRLVNLTSACTDACELYRHVYNRCHSRSYSFEAVDDAT